MLRLSGSSASAANGAKVTAALSFVSTSPSKLINPIAAAMKDGRRTNASSADRYTSASSVAWLSVQNRHASSWNSGTAMSSSAPATAAERARPICRPSRNVIGMHSALSSACTVRPTVNGSHGISMDSAAASIATERPSTPRLVNDGVWPLAHARARSRAWTAYRYSSDVGSPSRLLVV